MKNILLIPLLSFGASSLLIADAGAQSEPDSCVVSGMGIELTDEAEDGCLASSSVLGALDLVTPESTLFTLMGSTPDNVIRPKMGDKFSFSFLPQAVDAVNGEAFSVGFEVNPGLLILPESYAISDLHGEDVGDLSTPQNRTLMQRVKLLSQFTVSGAASKTTGDVEMTRYGIGLNFNRDTGAAVFDKGEFEKCAIPSNFRTFLNDMREQRRIRIEAFKLKNPSLSAIHPDFIKYAEVTAPKEVMESKWYIKNKVTPPDIDKCVEEIAPWNRNIFGGGVALYHSDVEAADPVLMAMADVDMTVAATPSDETGYGLWASMALKAGKQGQFTLSARYNDDLVRERTVMEEAMTESVDGWRIGSRYTRGFSKTDKAKGGTVKGFIEASYAEEDFGIINDSFTQAGLGVELQLQDNLFFQATIGDTLGSEVDRSTYLSGQFKWSFSKAAAK